MAPSWQPFFVVGVGGVFAHSQLLLMKIFLKSSENAQRAPDTKEDGVLEQREAEDVSIFRLSLQIGECQEDCKREQNED